MKLSLLFAFVSVSILLTHAANACADEVSHEEHVHVKPTLVEAFAEAGLGVRSVHLSGMSLVTGSISASKPRMTVSGDDVSVTVIPWSTLGGGLRVGPVLAGVEIGVGVGGGASAPTRASGDIDVRPSGVAIGMSAATYLGVMHTRRSYRLRLDGVLGTELFGLDMERPGFDDTSVSSVKQSRTTLGPRARVDLFVNDGPAIGIAVGCDALNPGNVLFGFVLTTL